MTPSYYPFQAANGIANLTCAAMVEEGLTEQQARDRVFMFDIDGLLTTTREGGVPAHAQNFGKNMEPEKDFEKAIAKVKPSCLIGESLLIQISKRGLLEHC